MIPGGMNPAQLGKMMKQLGINQTEIPATEVIIKTADKNLVIKQPSVMMIEAQGQKTFQIMGQLTEEAEKKEAFTEEDVKIVVEKTSKSEEEARKALEDASGDLTEAIMNLS